MGETDRGSGFFLGQKAYARGDVKVGLELSQRARGDGEVVQVFCAPLSTMPLRNVGGDGHRRSAYLRRQSKALHGRQLVREVIALRG